MKGNKKIYIIFFVVCSLMLGTLSVHSLFATLHNGTGSFSTFFNTFANATMKMADGEQVAIEMRETFDAVYVETINANVNALEEVVIFGLTCRLNPIWAAFIEYQIGRSLMPYFFVIIVAGTVAWVIYLAEISRKKCQY